jgi:hypothetical protein
VAPQLRRFRPFDCARTFARQLGLRSQAEWIKYCKGNLCDKSELPHDIPIAPHRVYRNEGWLGWGDWLGTGTLSPRFRRYRSLRTARTYVQQLSLANQEEWTQYCKGELPGKGNKPVDIPAAPDRIYQDLGWVSWGDWLGTGFVARWLRQYRTFQEARAFVQGLGLRGRREWTEYCKGRLPEKGIRPEDIPVAPDNVFRSQGWAGWRDWLGTQTDAIQLPPLRPLQETFAFGAPAWTAHPAGMDGVLQGHGT